MPNIEINVKVTDLVGNVSYNTKLVNVPILSVILPLSTISLEITSDENTSNSDIKVVNNGTPIELSLKVDDTEAIPLVDGNIEWRTLTKEETLLKSQMIIDLISGTQYLYNGYLDNYKLTETEGTIELARVKYGELVYNLKYFTGYARKNTIRGTYNLTFTAKSIY